MSSTSEKLAEAEGLRRRHDANDNIYKKLVRSADYSSSYSYAEAVREWVHETKCWYAFQRTITNSLSSTTPFVFPTMGFPLGATPLVQGNVNIQGFTIIQQQNGAPTVISTRRIASYARRFAAEMIDCVISLFIKFFIIYTLVELEYIDLDDFEYLLGNEADLKSVINITQDIFPFEILGKLIFSFLEAYCISYGCFGPRSLGQTPGKVLMGIRIIPCTALAPVAGAPSILHVTGPVTVPYKYALLRCLLKNLFVNSLIPLSTIAFAFNNNRALYDIAAKTIVVYV